MSVEKEDFVMVSKQQLADWEITFDPDSEIQVLDINANIASFSSSSKITTTPPSSPKSNTVPTPPNTFETPLTP